MQREISLSADQQCPQHLCMFVSGGTVGRLCQNIRYYISILNIQRTLVKLISLWSFNNEEHANGFTPLFSALNKPKQEA